MQQAQLSYKYNNCSSYKCSQAVHSHVSLQMEAWRESVDFDQPDTFKTQLALTDFSSLTNL